MSTGTSRGTTAHPRREHDKRGASLASAFKDRMMIIGMLAALVGYGVGAAVGMVV
jgi:hypothetical protein